MENDLMAPRNRRALLRVVAFTALSSISIGASAAPPKAAPVADARPKTTAELLKSGEAKYGAADYAGALADFEAADARQATPESARFIGLCEDKLGHFHPAVRAYERFLAAPPAKLAGEVGSIVKRVDELKAMPAKVHIETVPAGATVTVDGALQMQASPLDVTLTPGRHLVHVAAPEHDALEREVDVSFASTQSVAMELTAAPPTPPSAVAPPVAFAPAVPEMSPLPPPPSPAEPKATRRTVALAAAGVAVAGVGVATVFGILALDNKNSYRKSPTYSNSDNGNNDAAYSDGGIALAIAAGVTSLVLFLTNDSKACLDDCASSSAPKKPSAAFSASPFVTPHGAGAGAVVRF
jgi:PEGA domain